MVLLLFFFGHMRLMSCRTGLLRGGRVLTHLFPALRGLPVGQDLKFMLTPAKCRSFDFAVLRSG